MSVDSLKGRVAIVTGSAKNIGKAIALQLAKEGAAVLINARSSLREAKEVVHEIQAFGGNAVLHMADVSQTEGSVSLIASAIEQ